MYITLDKQVVMNMLDKPMADLKALQHSLLKMVNEVVEVAEMQAPWWDLMGKMRGNVGAKQTAGIGIASAQAIDSLYEHLAAMRSLAELAEGPVTVGHSDLLHVAGARKLVSATKGMVRGN